MTERNNPDNEYIEREVQRRVARQMANANSEIGSLRETVQLCQNNLVRQHNVIARLTAEPLTFGTLLKTHNFADKSKFKTNDEILVIDEASPHYLKGGRIVSGTNGEAVVDDEGYCFVKLMDDSEVRFAIGEEGKDAAQIRLTQKDDGTFAVVNLDGKPWEVRGVPDLSLQVGDNVKIKPDTKSIVCKGYNLSAGPICQVIAILDDCIEVMHKGEKQLVFNPRRIELEEGDRIACDPGMFCVIKKLPQDARTRYKVTMDLKQTWDDVGGLETAKQELRDALELPYQHPELFQHYDIEALRGVLLYGPPGCGKAGRLSSLVYTPKGPVRMGDIQLGQTVCTPDGGTANVVGVFPQGKVPIYRVTFSDGTYTECCGEHLWQVESRNGYKSGVLSTNCLKGKLKMRDGKRVYSIQMTEPVAFDSQEHKIHPYVLGALLGDGHLGKTTTITNCDDEVLQFVEELLPEYVAKQKKNRPCNFYVVRRNRTQPHFLKDELIRLGLAGKLSFEKFVPKEYLIDSVENRLALLQGLMDTDGTVRKNGMGCTYYTTSKQLSEDFKFLIESFGGKCMISEKQTSYTHNGEKKAGRVCYCCAVSIDNVEQLFRLSWKKGRVVEKTKRFTKRMIESIEYVCDDEAQCILIDHPDHLYLTDHFIVTHNTLLVRVMAWAMANVHGKDSVDTGYIYVKSPEILNKWVGNTELEIRELFERARRHYRENGYKAILCFDEADAIMPQRGTRLTSSIADTIVPMFLGEMDGIDSKQTEENPVVVLLTNRPDVLDPAVTRPGRISRHIKVERPDEMASIDVLTIHTKKMPFADQKNKMAILAITASDVFSKSRLLYRVNGEHEFVLGDCVNGAMLENIAQIAKMNALHRDIGQGTKTGVTTEDFRQAVKKVFASQRGVNHSYDLQDFCERQGIEYAKVSVERCFGAA